MKITLLKFLLLFIFLLVNSCGPEDAIPPINKRPAPKVDLIAGIVYNEFNQPLDGVSVSLVAKGKELTTTSEKGVYAYKNIEVGEYTLLASKPGYVSVSKVVKISEVYVSFPDIHLNSGEAYLTLSDSLKKAPFTADFINLTVQSNAAWAVKTDADWLTISDKEGTGNGQLKVSWSVLEHTEARTGTVELSAGTLKKVFRLVQGEKVRIIEHTAIPGNGARGIDHTIQVMFNKQVKVVAIRPKLTSCQSSLQPAYSDDKRSISFNYTCGKLGGTYRFDLEVEDLAYGLVTTIPLEVSFYTRKIEVPGRILDYAVDEASKTYWVVTAFPHKLLEISMSDLGIRKNVSLPLEPRGFAINYFTKEVFVFHANSPQLSVIDKNTGTLKRTLPVPPTPEDDIQYPLIYPYDIEFTDNGLGIVLLGSPATSGISWQIIDSQKGDYFYKPENNGLAAATFYFVNKNFDKSKLLLMLPYGDSGFLIFDQETRGFTSYRPPHSTRGGFISPSRKDEKVFMGQLHNQLIVNPITGFASSQTTLDNRWSGSADFSYKDQEALTVYFCDDNRLQVLDYARNETPVWYSVLTWMRGTTATTDGKYLILYNIADTHPKGGTSQVFQFTTAWL